MNKKILSNLLFMLIAYVCIPVSFFSTHETCARQKRKKKGGKKSRRMKKGKTRKNKLGVSRSDQEQLINRSVPSPSDAGTSKKEANAILKEVYGTSTEGVDSIGTAAQIGNILEADMIARKHGFSDGVNLIRSRLEANEEYKDDVKRIVDEAKSGLSAKIGGGFLGFGKKNENGFVKIKDNFEKVAAFMNENRSAFTQDTQDSLEYLVISYYQTNPNAMGEQWFESLQEAVGNMAVVGSIDEKAIKKIAEQNKSDLKPLLNAKKECINAIKLINQVGPAKVPAPSNTLKIVGWSAAVVLGTLGGYLIYKKTKQHQKEGEGFVSAMLSLVKDTFVSWSGKSEDMQEDEDMSINDASDQAVYAINNVENSEHKMELQNKLTQAESLDEINDLAKAAQNIKALEEERKQLTNKYGVTDEAGQAYQNVREKAGKYLAENQDSVILAMSAIPTVRYGLGAAGGVRGVYQASKAAIKNLPGKIKELPGKAKAKFTDAADRAKVFGKDVYKSGFSPKKYRALQVEKEKARQAQKEYAQAVARAEDEGMGMAITGAPKKNLPMVTNQV